MAEARTTAARWGTVATVACLLFAVAWWCRPADVEPPAPVAPVAQAETAVGGDAVAVLAEPVVERARAVLPDTAITGIVRDRAGLPLVGLAVTLQRQGEHRPAYSGRTQDYGEDLLATDDRGRFRFGDLEAADYVLATRVHAGPTVRVSLASGETKHSDLQFAAPIVMLWGVVRDVGEKPGPRRVSVVGAHRGGKLALERGVDRRGTYRCFVPPGNYTVRLQHFVAGVPQAEAWLVATSCNLVLADDAREVRCDFDSVTTRLVLRIEASEATPSADLTGLEVRAVRDGSAGEEPIAVVRKSTERSAEFDNLPPGVWRVTAKARGLVATAAQSVELSAARPVAEIVLQEQTAGIVRLRVRGSDGRLVTPLPGALPVLVAKDCEFVGADVSLSPKTISCGYDGVPPGPAELRCTDRVVDGRRSFLAFAPQPPRVLDVVAGDHNQVELQVELRARVQLRVVERFGREDPFARVTLFAGTSEVVSHETKPQAHRWVGYLPPGQYRAVIERKSGSSERRITVAREDLKLDLRP